MNKCPTAIYHSLHLVLNKFHKIGQSYTFKKDRFNTIYLDESARRVHRECTESAWRVHGECTKSALTYAIILASHTQLSAFLQSLWVKNPCQRQVKKDKGQRIKPASGFTSLGLAGRTRKGRWYRKIYLIKITALAFSHPLPVRQAGS